MLLLFVVFFLQAFFLFFLIHLLVHWKRDRCHTACAHHQKVLYFFHPHTQLQFHPRAHSLEYPNVPVYSSIKFLRHSFVHPPLHMRVLPTTPDSPLLLFVYFASHFFAIQKSTW